MKAIREPTATGFEDFHSTALMFSYQAIALSGSDAYSATSLRDRSITISVQTFTSTVRILGRASCVRRLAGPRVRDSVAEGAGWRPPLGVGEVVSGRRVRR